MTILLKREVSREKRDDFEFDAIGNMVDMVAVVAFELMGDAVAGKDPVEFPRCRN
jgi:hypothetical protein